MIIASEGVCSPWARHTGGTVQTGFRSIGKHHLSPASNITVSIEEAKKRNPETRTVQHENKERCDEECKIGQCFTLASGRYFWTPAAYTQPLVWVVASQDDHVQSIFVQILLRAG
mmetsp:Transcript_71554/g.119718  ORF Transcript_71554/g.119718 Transcript_71554/m.119718 type:complete len:115 (-) Transcript_71554:64-408(-)